MISSLGYTPALTFAELDSTAGVVCYAVYGRNDGKLICHVSSFEESNITAGMGGTRGGRRITAGREGTGERRLAMGPDDVVDGSSQRGGFSMSVPPSGALKIVS